MRLQDIKELNKDDVLSALGLTSKPSTGEWVLGTLGLFGLGVLVGASAALLMAPKTGTALRQDLGQRFNDIRTKIQDRAQTTAGENSFG